VTAPSHFPSDTHDVRAAAWTVAALLVALAISLAAGGHGLFGTMGVAATVTGVGAGFELLTAVLLIARASRAEGASLALVGGAFLFAGVLSTAAAVGVSLSSDGVAALDSHRGLLMWRHVGFAAFAASAALLPLSDAADRTVCRSLLLLVAALAVALGAAAIWVTANFGIAPGSVGTWLAVASALAMVAIATRGRRGEQRWLCVALVAGLCGLTPEVTEGYSIAVVAFGLLGSAALVPALVADDVHTAARMSGLVDTLEHAAGVDPLTELGNRRVFDRRLAEEWRRAARTGRSLSILMVDVDRFKRINDTLGHIAGDDVLKRIAGCLQASARRAGDLVARFGGDEFVVLLPEANGDQAARVAELMRSCVLEAQFAGDAAAGLPVTISIGTATVVPQAEGDPQALVKKADEALLEAKRSGRDRVIAA